jgi:hypothetical protein
MPDLIPHPWLIDQIAEHGTDVDFWSWHARNKAVSECLHNSENVERLNHAMADFFNNHGLKYLYMEDAVLPICKTREIVWNYLEPFIVEQIDRMEDEQWPI